MERKDGGLARKLLKGILIAACILIAAGGILQLLMHLTHRGHKLPEPSVDISKVSMVDGQNAEGYVMVQEENGKINRIPMDPEDASRNMAWSVVVDGIPYVSYGEIKSDDIILDELKGYWINDHFYRYVYSFNGLDPKEWLIDVRDFGKEPSPSDTDSMMVYKAIGVQDIPPLILEHCSRYH